MSSINPTSPRPVDIRPQSVNPQETQAPAAPQSPPAAPAAPVADPTQRYVDRMEGETAAPRQAGAAAGARPTSPARDPNPIRTINEVSRGIGERTAALQRANQQVELLERDLQQQLRERGPALSEPERERLRTAFRTRPENARHYAEVNRAAVELSGYMAQNAGRLREATGSLLPAQRPGAGHAAVRLAQANEALAQSRPNTPEARSTVLRNLGNAADVLGAGASVGAEVFDGFAEASRRLIGNAGGSLGIAGGVLSAADRLATLREGRGNAGDMVGLAGDGVGILGGAAGMGVAAARTAGLRVATSLAIGAGVASGVGFALSVGGTLYSNMVERQRTQADAERTLQAAGHDPATASGIAYAQPASLRAYERAGFSAEQIQELARSAPEGLRLSGDVSQRFLSVARGAGLSNEEIVSLLGAAGTSAVPLMMRGAEIASEGVPSSREEFLRQLGTRSFMGDPQQLAGAIEFLRGLPTRP